MQTERPVRDFRRSADDISILARDLGWVVLIASQEVEVKDAANDVVLEGRAKTLRVVDLDVHAVRVGKEDTVRARLAVLKVDRVVSVQVLTLGHAIRVARPERAGVVVRREAERVGVLAETVEVRVLGEVRLHAQVLRLEDDRVRRGGEENLLGLGAVDREAERRGSVVEADARGERPVQEVCLWTGEDLLGNLVPLVCGVGDLDVNAILWSRRMSTILRGTQLFTGA